MGLFDGEDSPLFSNIKKGLSKATGLDKPADANSPIDLWNKYQSWQAAKKQKQAEQMKHLGVSPETMDFAEQMALSSPTVGEVNLKNTPVSDMEYLTGYAHNKESLDDLFKNMKEQPQQAVDKLQYPKESISPESMPAAIKQQGTPGPELFNKLRGIKAYKKGIK